MAGQAHSPQTRTRPPEVSLSTSNIDFVASEPSSLGMVCLRHRKLLSQPGVVATEITLEHELLMSSANTTSERALSTDALAQHPGRDLSVLVGGLGLGYTAEAVLESDRVAKVDVVEFLPPVIRWFKEGMVPLSAALNAEPRLNIVQGDVFALLTGSGPERWDLILVDVDHSPAETLGDESYGFYDGAGLVAAREHLNDDGVLGVWSYASDSPFADSLREVFSEVSVVEVEAPNPVFADVEIHTLFLARK